MRYAGFWLRVGAYCLDALPISIVVMAVFYLFFSFDETLERYWGARTRGDTEAILDIYVQRNYIRNISLCLNLIYSTIMEGSPLRGTLGKWLLGIAVVDLEWRRLSIGRAALRNLGKILSFLVLGLGCLWVAWSEEKRAWHDYLAGTLVIRTSGEYSGL